MNRRTFLTSIPAVAAASAQSARRRPPNVIVLLTDDQGYGDLACHGNPLARTPHLDRLHAESVRFTNFHVDPTCSPTRSALMTGQYSHRVGVWHTIIGRNFLHRDAVTMADAFRASGYRTGLFGKWHLGTNYPFRPVDRGFDTWVGHGNGGIGTSSDYWNNQKLDDTYYRNGVWEKFHGFSTDVFFSEAMQFISGSGKQPFFLYLPTNLVHNPLNLPEEWLQPWKERTSDPTTARFYASIERIDTNVGRLMAFLAARGLLDNTILLFITDNGGTGGVRTFNAGMRGAKGSVYDGGHRVPCFVRWPSGGIGGGRDINRLSAHVDILPTLIELCGLKHPDVAFDGRSLVPLLRGESAAWRDRTIFVETQRIQFPRMWKDYAMMTDQWRLVNGELFDMRADAGQQRDIAGSRPEVVRQLRAEYERVWKSISGRDNELGRAVIGNRRQETIWLAPDERFTEDKLSPWDQPHVRVGKPAGGYWAAEIEADGTYEFVVRRWPREAEAAICSGLPALPADGRKRIFSAPEGVALALVKARIKVNGAELSQPIPHGAGEIVFRLPLKRGPADIHAWFDDASGDGSRGVYYIYAKHVS